MIVLNTIGSAQEIYRFIQALPLEDTKTVFLSTNIIPKVRLERIDEIRKSSKNGPRKRKVIVSTQLIEAGVDIDADIVYTGKISHNQTLALVKLLGIDLAHYDGKQDLSQYQGAVFLETILYNRAILLKGGMKYG